MSNERISLIIQLNTKQLGIIANYVLNIFIFFSNKVILIALLIKREKFANGINWFIGLIIFIWKWWKF